jgi:isochorismate pyruvate lyase
MTPCETLADVRSAIDQIDFMLVGLLAERGRYVSEAARFKRNAAEVAAPERVQQVIDKALRHARSMGAAPEVVEAVYRSMVASFIELEAQVHARQAVSPPQQDRHNADFAKTPCQPALAPSCSGPL